MIERKPAPGSSPVPATGRNDFHLHPALSGEDRALETGIPPLPLFKVFMSARAIDAAKAVLGSGYVGQGPRVDEFERALRERFCSDFVLTTNSGTSSLHLAMHLLQNPDPASRWPGIERGDEVLTTPLTCTATNWPILANGFRIKWVDVAAGDLNMDLDDLARKITPKTKVIVVVHWAGYPCDLGRIRAIQRATRDLYGFEPVVIEDCAHAFGATYANAPIGSHGNICCFSFQAIKHLTAVDGGALVLPSERLYRRGKLVRWYGIDRENNSRDFRCEADIAEWGFKFHMNDLNAAIGLANLGEIDGVLDRHRDNAAYYRDQLTGVPGLELLESRDDRSSSFWQFTIKVRSRDAFMRKMRAAGIIVSRVHERNDKHTCVREFRVHLPTIDRVVDEMVCIPVGWWVTDEERSRVVDVIKGGW